MGFYFFKKSIIVGADLSIPHAEAIAWLSKEQPLGQKYMLSYDFSARTGYSEVDTANAIAYLMNLNIETKGGLAVDGFDLEIILPNDLNAITNLFSTPNVTLTKYGEIKTLYLVSPNVTSINGITTVGVSDWQAWKSSVKALDLTGLTSLKEVHSLIPVGGVPRQNCWGFYYVKLPVSIESIENMFYNCYPELSAVDSVINSDLPNLKNAHNFCANSYLKSSGTGESTYWDFSGWKSIENMEDAFYSITGGNGNRLYITGLSPKKITSFDRAFAFATANPDLSYIVSVFSVSNIQLSNKWVHFADFIVESEHTNYNQRSPTFISLNNCSSMSIGLHKYRSNIAAKPNTLVSGFNSGSINFAPIVDGFTYYVETGDAAKNTEIVNNSYGQAIAGVPAGWSQIFRNV